jgi:hypothetical protein
LAAVACSYASPSYLDAKPISGAWSISVTGSNVTSWNWDVTLHAVTGFYGGTIRDAQGFIVYDDDAATSPGSDLGWSLGTPTNGASVEWKRTGQQAYLLPEVQKDFWATINDLDDSSKVVFHVREIDAAGRTTTYFARESDEKLPPTPELSTWLLLTCSGLAGAVVIRRRRK